MSSPTSEEIMPLTPIELAAYVKQLETAIDHYMTMHPCACPPQVSEFPMKPCTDEVASGVE